MAKPILLVGISNTEMFMSHGKDVRDYITKWVKDEYHVLIYNNEKIEGIHFEVLNADDLTPLQFDELKEIVNNSIYSNG